MSMKDDKVNDIFFSIITPNYNSGDKLLRAIKSLEGNSTIFEHIIIDDCSTDDSFSSIEKSEASNQSNLVLFTNSSNVGPGVSRNIGLDFAKGQYVIFLDADDYFLDKALDTLYDIIKSKDKIDILVFNYYMITQSNCELDLSNDSDVISSIKNPVHDYLLDRIISSPWCKCLEAELAKSFRFPDLRVTEDAIYNLDIFMTAKVVSKVDTTLYIFDKTKSGSLTRKAFDRKEFIKFHEGWNAFEKKARMELKLQNSNRLLASRKIRFEVVYYISRMVVSPNNKLDKFIVSSVRKSIRKNILLARSELSVKIKLLCFMFYFFPSLTISLARFYNIF